MSTEIKDIQQTLIDILKEHLGVLKITADEKDKFEVSGTIEAMQGKKKVDGIYFATVVPKPKDVRFYFFPTYSHKAKLGELSPDLKKCLKGKSCFHIKQLDKALEDDLRKLVADAIVLYQKDGLLKK